MAFFKLIKPEIPKPATRLDHHKELLLIARSSPKKDKAKLIKKQQVLRERWQEFSEFLDWITEIQKSLKLTDQQFADRLGITRRMLYYYKSKSGHFPSRRVYRRLLHLEKLISANITITKNVPVAPKPKRFVHEIIIE